MSSPVSPAVRHFPPDALIEIAAYATEGRVEQEAAYEVAYYALLEALTRMLRALRDPQCTRFLGPVVPGATMAFGARVPGTSYVLDPVQAAFNIGLLLGAADAPEPAFCRDGACFADTLGAVLPVADFLSRKAIPDAKPAATMHDLLRVSIKAREIQRCIAGAGDIGHEGCVMVAAAAVSAAMFGASRAHVAAALAAGLRRTGPGDVAQDPHERWRTGEAVSHGVRVALLALAGSAAEYTDPSGSGSDAAPLPGEGLPCVTSAEQLAATGALVLHGLEAAVAGHFPPAQATKLQAIFADRARVGAMPVHEFVSLLVRN